MRILILPALVASGLLAQTPVPKLFQPATTPNLTNPGNQTKWFIQQSGDGTFRVQQTKPRIDVQLSDVASQFAAQISQAQSTPPTNLFPQDWKVAAATSGNTVLTGPGLACSIPLIDATPSNAATMDPKIVIGGSAPKGTTFQLDNPDHMPAIQVPAPPCVPVKK